MKLTVVGCGKMGLPLAVQAAHQGISVIGVDVNESIISMINRGESPIDEPEVSELLAEAVARGELEATTDIKRAVKCSDAVIVIVPVLVNSAKQVNLDAISSVAVEIGAVLHSGTIVSFETTVPVGTTRNHLMPLLESKNMKAERDFFLIFSPERVKSQLVLKRLNRTPKIVGAVGPRSLEKGLELYRSILDAKVISVGSLENAEMIKIAGMVYRDVNIALANEIARYCDAKGINISKLVPLINSDGETHFLQPGIGVGGHCTPVYPYFLIHDSKSLGVKQTLAKEAREINDSQAEYIVHRLGERLNNIINIKVLILGLGFRPEVKEDINSPAYLVNKALLGKGAHVSLYDPLYSKDEILKKGFTPADLCTNDHIDAVILVTYHKAFSNIDWNTLKKRGVTVFVDGRNSFHRDSIEKYGIYYIGIG